MVEYFTRKVRRVGFFLHGALNECVPRRLLDRQLERLKEILNRRPDKHSILARVNYYNRLTKPFEPGKCARSCEALSRSEGSYYYYDLKRYWRMFPPGLRLNYLFGDTVHVPDEPSIVKSRPVGTGNQNSVLFKLDGLRHFELYKQRDNLPFRQKQPCAVWRGLLNNPLRKTLVERYADHSRHNIAHVGQPRLDCAIPPRDRLDVGEQLGYRYILSVEGYDVATNLKWIFASQSLCMMPRPRFETWFMEGRLQAGVHYVELRSDFADLENKVAYFNQHPEEAEAIISNANRHLEQFTDRATEYLVSLLVLQKYFERSGQLPPLGVCE